jgi:hypothetical protein
MPLINVPKSENLPDYNFVAIKLEDEGFDALFLMFWLQGLRGEAFWRFPDGTREYWHYTPAQREYLQKTDLLSEYAQRIPEIHKLLADATPTGVYSGWDEQRQECCVQFSKVMDEALLWVHGQVQHLIVLHQMDAPGKDLARWACKEWLHYHLRKYSGEGRQTGDGGQGSGGDGSAIASNGLDREPEPKSRQEADDAAAHP